MPAVKSQEDQLREIMMSAQPASGYQNTARMLQGRRQPVRHWAEALGNFSTGLSSHLNSQAAAQAEQQQALAQARLKQMGGGGPNTYQKRAEAARQFGLDPESAAGREFILTGDMPKAQKPSYFSLGNVRYQQNPDGSTREVMRAPLTPMQKFENQMLGGLVGGGGQASPQPQVQPQSAPGPQVVPQTNVLKIGNAGQGPLTQRAQAATGPAMQVDPNYGVQPVVNQTPAQADPNLIQVTEGQQQPGQEMVQIPGFKPMTRQQAEQAINLFAMKGNKAMADRIQQAIGGDQNQALQPGKKVSNELETRLMNSTENVVRLGNIKKMFKPEYQTIGTQAFMAGADIWEKFGGPGSLDPETEQKLAEYSAFRQEAINNINLYIKEITGAQMSEAEAVRLRQGVPDPGDGIGRGDSPTKFKSKMENTLKSAMAAQMRYHFLATKGYQPQYKEGVDPTTGESYMRLQSWTAPDGRPARMPSLGEIEKTYNRRANQLLKQFGGDKTRAKQKLMQEFGV